MLPQETRGVSARWSMAGCSALQAEVECAPCLGVVGLAWTCAASRSVPGDTSAAAIAVAMSACRCLVVKRPKATIRGQHQG